MDENDLNWLAAIEHAQSEMDSLNEIATKEIIQIENKYNKLRKPLYEKRATIIDRIPNFWAMAILNHPQISKLIDEEEEHCLYFLNKLEVEEFENVEYGFRIKFIFDENPFFDNAELVKEFQFGPNIEPKSTSTAIQWKEKLDLSKKQKEIMMERRKRGLEVNTFFSWYSDNSDPIADDIAEVIKDDLWPNPLMYYLTPGGDEHDFEDGDEGNDVEEPVVMEEEVVEDDKAAVGEDEEEELDDH